MSQQIHDNMMNTIALQQYRLNELRYKNTMACLSVLNEKLNTLLLLSDADYETKNSIGKTSFKLSDDTDDDDIDDDD